MGAENQPCAEKCPYLQNVCEHAELMRKENLGPALTELSLAEDMIQLVRAATTAPVLIQNF